MAEADLSSAYSDSSPAPPDAVQQGGETMKIRLFESLLEQHSRNRQWIKERTSEEWVDKIFKEAAFYEGVDELLWGQFFICIYKDQATAKLSSLVVDKLGVSHFNPVDISSKSQFYPAIENLDPKDRDSNVRKCIAVSLLQKFAQLPDDCVNRIQPKKLKFDYDPTHAGDLASGCKLVDFCTPENIGKSLRILGILGHRYIQSSLIDVIYENNPKTSEQNNRIVFNLGEQLEQLFDPLNEYSPEQTEYIYKAPESEETLNHDSELVKSISKELLELQMAFTLTLVEFLQSFLINLRIQVLNNEIEGLSTMKLNRLFPPTIDEVTRINCIFLDSLKSATPYGSFEVLKACSVTIPYFYKAYTRHEAATKNFSKDIKLFLRRFQESIPEKNTYTEMKIETIIRGPQERLMKIRLIIDRLYAEKDWPKEIHSEAEKNYKSIIQVIDSFGKLESPLSSYSTRVFTPSGKILTELAKGWPVELQYKWLKRRIVGIFDIVDVHDSGKRQLLVIFSDYVVFLDINRADLYYAADGKNRPQLADILMNSLINEIPLPPKIPKLTVNNYCYIDDVFVSLIEERSIRFDCLKTGDSFSSAFIMASNSVDPLSVAELVVKAKILEKETAFHLFRATNDDVTIFSTAHELEAYQNEKIKSRFGVFLNMDISNDLLINNKLHLAMSLNFVMEGQKEKLELKALTISGQTRKAVFPPSDLVSALLDQLTLEIPVCFSSIESSFLPALIELNEQLINRIRRDFNSSENDPVVLANCDNTETFIREHEKKKSFGTITTYRSHASDLKDTLGSTRNSGEIQLSTEDLGPAKHKTPVKHAFKRQENLLSSKKINTAKKRRSIVDLVKGIFGSKTPKKSKPRKLKSTNEGVPNDKASKKNRKGVKVTDEPSQSQPEIERGNNTLQDSQRVSSVVRNSQFTPKDNPSIAGSQKIEKIENIEIQKSAKLISEPMTSRNLPQHPDASFASIQSEETALGERLAEHPADISSNVRSDSGKQFYGNPGRQSQLFNDDLFGELGTTNTEASHEEQGNVRRVLVSRSTEKVKSVSSPSLSQHSKAISSQSIDLENNFEIIDKNDGVQAANKPQHGDETKPQSGNIATFDAVERKAIEIFPSIPPPNFSKIAFQRSSSYIELFEGMRLILDDSDAQYNWKCLSNDIPSNGGLVNDEKRSAPHVFNSIATAAADSFQVNAKVTGQKTPIAKKEDEESPVSDEDSTNKSPIATKNEIIDSSPAHTMSSANSFESIFEERATMLGKSNTAQATRGFKVVKSSPTRIIKRPLQPINIEAADQNITYNFSLTSDLDQGADQRWFELKMPSQEDVDTPVFFTPHEDPSPQFSDEQHNSGTTSPFESNANVETSQDTITPENPLQKGSDAMLDDLEFSSFHMTFESAGGNSDESSYASPDNVVHKSPHYNLPISQKQTGPLVYRLPMDIPSTKAHSERDATMSLNSSGDNEPIWVSPSKLDFYDLSNITDIRVVHDNSRLSEKTNGDKEPSTVNEKVETNKTTLRELSYAYLASLVTPTESNFEGDDKPTRLQFEE